jgi:peptide/nickel transport system substrate-binding protein
LLALGVLVAACTGQAEVTTTSAPATTTTSAATTTEAPPPPECPDAFCIRYHIRPEAAWADGTPVTAGDFAFTVETVRDADLDIAETIRADYSLITGYEIVDDKTFLAIFSEVYAPWRKLFEVVLPAHELSGKSFNDLWDEAITLGSGPFQFSEYVAEESISITRNPNYWATVDPASGAPVGDVQSLRIDFLGDSDTLVDALRDEEIDMFYPEPAEDLVDEVTSMGDVTSEVGKGRLWEHIDFNHDDPLLSKKFVREAFAMAIDREEILDEVVRPMAEDASALGNTVWLEQTPYYQDHFTEPVHDPEAARQLLTANGCVEGEDGIFSCDDQRLSFRWATIAGVEGRETLFDIAEADLREVGIEVIADFGPAARLFANEFIYGDSSVWQILNFAWLGDADPSGRSTVYHCEGTAPSGFGNININRYCNDEIEGLVRQAETEVDPEVRAELYNQADAQYLADVAVIPLYQRPSFFAWNDVITGPRDNPSSSGPLWNISTWSGKADVVFGVDQGPATLNILESAGNHFTASLVSSAILEGAFTVAPDFTYVPVLVSSADVIVTEG